jgi:peptide deformylase
MRELLSALTDEEKTEIKRELDHIGKMILTFEDDDDYLSITLKETTGNSKWHTVFEGSVTLMNITIHTNSDIVKHIVRKSFTQAAGCLSIEEDTEIKKIERSTWINERNQCCSKCIKV